MGLFSSIDISASGLTAERLRMDIISNNIANINTTRTENGQPYRRKVPVFAERKGRDFYSLLKNSMGKRKNVGNGVKVVGIVEDSSPFKKVYDPNHPHADEKGYVSYPNVNIVAEMVDMISAARAYEANVTAINISKSMFMKALELGRI